MFVMFDQTGVGPMKSLIIRRHSNQKMTIFNYYTRDRKTKGVIIVVDDELNTKRQKLVEHHTNQLHRVCRF